MATPMRVRDTAEMANTSVRDSYKIRSTMQYSMFRFIDGNRDASHAAKIKKSIEEVGLLVCPVLINENWEIIDGQGRFTACKELNLPVYYVMQKGIGIEEVRKMNSVSSNWKTGDYVHSYTEGTDTNECYILLENLTKQFPDFGISLVASVACQHRATYTIQQIKNGEFSCTQEQYENAIRTLTYLNKFAKYVKTISGKADYIYRALWFCYDSDEIDNDYLLYKFGQRYKQIKEVASIRGALECIEAAYNYRQDAAHDPVFIISDYDRFIRLSAKENLRR